MIEEWHYSITTRHFGPWCITNRQQYSRKKSASFSFILCFVRPCAFKRSASRWPFLSSVNRFCLVAFPPLT
jgi:hypothetical protein